MLLDLLFDTRQFLNVYSRACGVSCGLFRVDCLGGLFGCGLFCSLFHVREAVMSDDCTILKLNTGKLFDDVSSSCNTGDAIYKLVAVELST